MHVRLATTHDAAALARVQITSYRTAYAPFLPTSFLAQFSLEEQTQDWHDLLAVDNDESVHVAQADAGEIVGDALGRPQASGGVHFASELIAMHVLPSHQRQGVGRRLFAVIATHLQQHGCASLVVWVLARNPARACYKRLRGDLVGSQHQNIDGTQIKEVAYGWPNIEQPWTRLLSNAFDAGSAQP